MTFLFPWNYKININPEIVFAYDRSVIIVNIKAINLIDKEIPSIKIKSELKIIEGGDLIESINYDTDKSIFTFRSTGKPGEVILRFLINGYSLPVETKINILNNYADSDGDGFIDLLELNSSSDKLNFRKWFCSIAISQFYQYDDEWSESERDCSGLIRFAFREALKKHDDLWRKEKRFIFNNNIEDVKKYNYPDVPVLHDRIFALRHNKYFNDEDYRNGFSAFADTKTLKNYSLFFYQKI